MTSTATIAANRPRRRAFRTAFRTRLSYSGGGRGRVATGTGAGAGRYTGGGPASGGTVTGPTPSSVGCTGETVPDIDPRETARCSWALNHGSRSPPQVR